MDHVQSTIWAGEVGVCQWGVLVRRGKGAGGSAWGVSSNPELSPHDCPDNPDVGKHGRFSLFSLPASTDSTPALASSHQGHHSAGFDKCHLFPKVALEKGNLTAVRQNREPKGSPLSTRAQSREQSQEEWELPGAPGPPPPGTCVQRPGPGVGSPPPSFPLPALVFCTLFPGW